MAYTATVFCAVAVGIARVYANPIQLEERATTTQTVQVLQLQRKRLVYLCNDKANVREHPDDPHHHDNQASSEHTPLDSKEILQGKKSFDCEVKI